MNHQRDALNNGSRYTCRICQNFETDSENLWNEHLITHRVACPHCARVLSRRDNLERHIRLVHEGEVWLPPVIGFGAEAGYNFEDEFWSASLTSRRETQLGFYSYQFLIKIKNFTEDDNSSVENRLAYIRTIICSIGDRCRQFLTDPSDTIQLILTSLTVETSQMPI